VSGSCDVVLGKVAALSEGGPPRAWEQPKESFAFRKNLLPKDFVNWWSNQ